MKQIKNYFYRFGMKTQQAISLVIAGAANAFILLTAHAQTAASGISGVTNASTLGTNVLCPIFNGLFSIFMVVSVIMVLWAAFTYMRAQDDAEKVTQATKTLTYAAVGIVVALVAKAFPTIIAGFFSGASVTSCS